jgi:hypothetical protein
MGRAMRAFGVACCVWLAGCSSLTGVNPDINYEVMIAAVVKDCDQPPAQNTSASTAMEVGFTKVLAACQTFFDNATRAQQNAQAADKGLDVLLVAATAIINPTVSAAAAAKAITISTAGVMLSKTLIDDYNSVYAFNNYLYKVQKLTSSSMEDYMSKARQSPPANYCLAYTYVQKLAMLCSLSTLKSTLDQQVALPSTNTPNSSNPPQTASPASPPSKGRMGRSSEWRPAVTDGSSGPPSISYSVRPAYQ